MGSRRPPAWSLYLVACAVLAAGYYASTGAAKALLYCALGVSSAAVTVVGVHRYRPHAAWAWYLMAVGRLLFTAGDVGYAFQRQDTFPSISDPLYLSYYPLLVIAVLGFVRARRPGSDRPGLLDALILSTGAAMLAWVFLVVPYVRGTDMTLLARMVSLAYPVGDLLVLGVLLRLTTGRGDRPWAYRLFVAGMIAMLAADVGYAMLELTIGYQTGNAIDVLWLIMYALAGAASLHPSMAAMSQRNDGQAQATIRPGRIVALAGASLMAPAVLAIEWLRGMPIDVPVIVAGCAVLFLLVIFRLHGVVALLSATLRLVEEQATHDQLTGLANRRLFHHSWEQALGRTGGSTALLYVDLDGFKAINDAFGHDVGDAVLVGVADRLRTIVRTGDVVARLGGDEFAVILPWTDDATAHAIAERLVATLAEPFLGAPFPAAERPVHIGASAGVVTANPGADPEAELRRADVAMYSAKSAGRGRIHVA
jgi:diguanylate cyclase (GGDEF)-like protein